MSRLDQLPLDINKIIYKYVYNDVLEELIKVTCRIIDDLNYGYLRFPISDLTLAHSCGKYRDRKVSWHVCARIGQADARRHGIQDILVNTLDQL